MSLHSVYIRDWKDFRRVPKESKTHVLKIDEDMCCGWLKAKKGKGYDWNIDFLEQVEHLDVYLNTHMFYDEQYEFYTKVLQRCGFDVQLANHG